MNETYLIITGLLVAYTITQISTGALGYNSSNLRGCSTFVAMFISISLLIFSLLPLGDRVVTYSDATNTKVNNELIITSKFPTQIVTDIKFVDKPVRVKRTEMYNAWGGGSGDLYEVELIEE